MYLIPAIAASLTAVRLLTCQLARSTRDPGATTAAGWSDSLPATGALFPGLDSTDRGKTAIGQGIE